MNQFIRFLFIFSTIWLIMSLFGFGQPKEKYTDDIVIKAKNEYSIGAPIQVQVLNNTQASILLPNDCTKTPLITEKYSNGKWEVISAERFKKPVSCDATITIEAGEERSFSYIDESYTLFHDLGKYRVVVNYNNKVFAHEFELTNPGIFKTLFHKTIFSPILNLLIWLVEVAPTHSLGIAIIILTLIIKTALLLPNHKALKSQKALQKIQPELQEIKEKFKGDQARIAQETMAVWKRHKVNPAGSCLPILLQFPFLIAIFFVLKDGLTPNNMHFVYEVLQPFDFSIINPYFLGMDLTKFGPWYLAFFVGAAQFFQMKLTFKNAPAGGNDFMAQQMAIMNKVFTYALPFMIGFFTLTTPAGVGIYWGLSTVYTIAQQQITNKLSAGKHHSHVEEAEKPKAKKESKKKKEEVEDAVIVHKV